MSASLYETDFARWSEEQAEAIRRAASSGTNLPLDWENIAEEIESLGKSQRTELRSRLGTIVEHLLKLAHSPGAQPRAGWVETVVRECGEVAILLEENPSLRQTVPDVVERLHAKRAELAALSLARHGELGEAMLDDLRATRFTAEQVVGDWLPPPRPGA